MGFDRVCHAVGVASKHLISLTLRKLTHPQYIQ